MAFPFRSSCYTVNMHKYEIQRLGEFVDNIVHKGYAQLEHLSGAAHWLWGAIGHFWDSFGLKQNGALWLISTHQVSENMVLKITLWK